MRWYIKKAPLLEEWLKNVAKAIDEAVVCVSAGSPEHWTNSLEMAVKTGGYLVWGWRQNADLMVRITSDGRVTLEVHNRGGALVKSFAEKYLSSVNAKKPIVVLFYASGKGCIGAGFVLNLLIDYQTLFWKEEIEQNRVIFPFRWVMRVFWLRDDVRSNLARGKLDPVTWRSEEPCINVVPRSAIQCYSNEKIVNSIKTFLKSKIGEITETIEFFEDLSRSASAIDIEETIPAPSRCIDRNPEEVVEEIANELFIDLDTVRWVVFNVLAGRNILLVGKPGTGKTMLARLVAEKLCYKPYIVTANAHWSRFDVVGGIVLRGGRVVWRSGFLIRALVEHVKARMEGLRGVLLIIDEVNRADVDKAFGDFFTIFSGLDENEWIIPESMVDDIKSYGEDLDEYAKEFLKLIAVPRNRVNGGYRVPQGFRIICTMNYVDVRNLFVLGEAFSRRFVRIVIDYPRTSEDVRKELEFLLRKAAKRIGIAEEEAHRALEAYMEKLENVVLNLREHEDIAFGPAHVLTVLETLLKWCREKGAIDANLVQRAIESVLTLSELWNEDVKQAVEKSLRVLTSDRQGS